MVRFLKGEGRRLPASLEHVDFSCLDDKRMLDLVDYPTIIEKAYIGKIWSNPHFRMVEGQEPYEVKTKTIDTPCGIDYDALRLSIYSDPAAHVILLYECRGFFPQAVNAKKPWVRDYSGINQKAEEIIKIYQNLKQNK
ncbi:MAG: hypothetical protein ACOCZ6_02125 [Nanoarchaeota archaeon]